MNYLEARNFIKFITHPNIKLVPMVNDFPEDEFLPSVKKSTIENLKRICEDITTGPLTDVTLSLINDIYRCVSYQVDYVVDKELPHIKYRETIATNSEVIKNYLTFGSLFIIRDGFNQTLAKDKKIIDSRAIYNNNHWGHLYTYVNNADAKNARYCNYCNEVFYETANGSDDICPRCQELNIKTCFECGRKINTLKDDYEMVDDDICCVDCYQKIQKYFIKSYHNNPPLEYYDYDSDGQNKRVPSSNFKGYGIELEVGKKGQKNRMSEAVLKILKEEAYTMRDGSINRDEVLGGEDEDYGGFEIITHPHTEKALYNMDWEEAFKFLLSKGYRSHDIETCGLHMHISRALLTKKAIINMMYFYDKWYKDVVKFARRKMDDATHWANFNLPSNSVTWEAEKTIFDRWDKQGSHSARYVAVNIQNQNTVEIRIMRGTLKLSTFLASLDFLITIAKNAKKITPQDIDSLPRWLAGMKPETYQYMAERRCFGFAPDQPINEFTELEENIKVDGEQQPEVEQQPTFYNPQPIDTGMWRTVPLDCFDPFDNI